MKGTPKAALQGSESVARAWKQLKGSAKLARGDSRIDLEREKKGRTTPVKVELKSPAGVGKLGRSRVVVRRSIRLAGSKLRT